MRCTYKPRRVTVHTQEVMKCEVWSREVALCFADQRGKKAVKGNWGSGSSRPRGTQEGTAPGSAAWPCTQHAPQRPLKSSRPGSLSESFAEVLSISSFPPFWGWGAEDGKALEKDVPLLEGK